MTFDKKNNKALPADYEKRLSDYGKRLKESARKRKSHYYFVHMVLRGLLNEDPRRFIGFMKSPKACEYLSTVYNDIKSRSDDEVDIEVTEKDFSVHLTIIEDKFAIIITLPKTIRVAEAKFVGIVFIEEVEFVEEYNVEKIRYYTLEQGESIMGGEHNVLCEWKGTGEKSSHLQYLSRPDADVESFKESIERILPN